MIELDINGVKHKIDAEPETSLLEVIREDLGMTGTKFGCGESQCGACTVLVDNEPTRSCVMPISDVVGQKIVTIEGLEKDGKLQPIQQAFIDEGAMQCGYCVAGMIMNAHGLLTANPNPTDAQIVARMNGNLCRCGGYPRMMAAIKRAAAAMKEHK